LTDPRNPADVLMGETQRFQVHDLAALLNARVGMMKTLVVQFFDAEYNYRPIEIALFGRFAPGVGPRGEAPRAVALRRHPYRPRSRKVGEGRPLAYSGRLKSPSLGASRLVSACADTLIGAGAERAAKADRWPIQAD